MCLEWSEEKFRLPVFALVAGWFLLRAVAIARTAPSLGRCAKAGVLESPHCGASPLTYGGARLAAVFAVDSNLQPKHKAWPIGKVQGQYKCKVRGKDPRTVSCGMRFKSRLPRSFLAHRPIVLVALHKATFPAVAHWPEEHKSAIRRSVVITTGHEPLPRSLDAPGTI
jgi:hypothetical protein